MLFNETVKKRFYSGAACLCARGACLPAVKTLESLEIFLTAFQSCKKV